MPANDRQVGGTHYKTASNVPQHWDLAVMYQWDPFQYQITKYVMRWKSKHETPEKRLDDLKKARHFLDKYIEEAEKYDPQEKIPGFYPSVKSTLFDKLYLEDEYFQCEGGFGDGTQLYKCRRCGSTNIRARDLADAFLAHGDCPSAAYVNQDR